MMRPKKFVGAQGTYEWPRYRLEYDATQPLVLALVDLPGADFAYDQLEDSPAVRGTGSHTIRYLLIGEPDELRLAVDTLRSVCYYNARGWLHLADEDGTERRCYARLSAMPDVKLTPRDRQTAPQILTFTQLSDFYELTAIDEHDGAVQVVGSDPDTLLVNNPGNARIHNAKITIKGPFAGLRLQNNSLDVPNSSPAVPWAFESDSVGAGAVDWLEVDAGANTVRISHDSGATWADASADVVLQDGQVGLMALAAGVNDFTVEGANGATIVFEFAGGWL